MAGNGPVVARGLSTWFCCGPSYGPCSTAGGGACGDCRSSRWQCAWPNASQACFDITRPDRCGVSLPRYGCDHGFHVANPCTGKSLETVTIADCGPDTDRFCRERRCCGDDCSSHRILDLTPAAFSRLADLAAGVIQVVVRNASDAREAT
ncbi:MAG: hypothetical protein GEV03_13505 [Streptosporangiales bacterium]|nr:hypothetical protein [Streptosporangiales bacterium]